ncbi:uncharacterized protein LOC144351301 [Saccoglossus kowalevskii]
METLATRIQDIETDKCYKNELIKEVEEKIGVIPPTLLKALKVDDGVPEVKGFVIGGDDDDTRDFKTHATTDCLATAYNESGDEIGPCTMLNAMNEQVDGDNMGMDGKLRKLKADIMALREMDVKLMYQLLAINDGIEELKWVHESFDISASKDSVYSSRDRIYCSREILHEKWVEMRSLASISSESLFDTSFQLNVTSGGVGRFPSNNLNVSATGSKYARMRSSDYLSPPTNLLMGRRCSSGEHMRPTTALAAVLPRRSSVCTGPRPITALPLKETLSEAHITNTDFTDL